MVSLNLSKLIYSAPTYPYMSPFYQAGATVPAAFADSPNGERNSQGLYLRKQGTQGLWFFNDFQLMLAPESEAYEYFNHTHSWEIDSRGDLPSIGWIPFTDSTLLYTTYTFLGNEANEVNTFNQNSDFYETPLAVPEQSENYALGFESQLSGGGSLIFEGADSYWSKDNAALYPQYANESLSDQAYYMTLSKSLGRMIFAFQGSQVGPYFVPGGHQALSSGDQQYDRTGGLALDSLEPLDPRNNSLDSSWKTIAEDQAWISNNTRRASLQMSWLDSWGSLGATFASSEQIDPSGPWIEASEFFNNSPYNGFSFFQLFYNNYTLNPTGTGQQSGEPNAEYKINAPTESTAYYKGSPISSVVNPTGEVNWDDLEQLGWRNTTQTIWLSQNGVGDNNLRADSTKYYNTFRADLSLDLGSIFKSPRKDHLQLYTELRDTAEELRLAIGATPDLLYQSIYGMDYIWQFATNWEFVATAGQEVWTSDMSYYPVQFIDNTAGIGFNSLLSHIVAGGLEVNYRFLLMQHEDSNFAEKDFSGWRGTVGLTYIFSNSN